MERRTVDITRPSPYGNGWEKVQLGIDVEPLEYMHYRRQITTAEKQAGDRFKSAYEAVSGSRGLGMDYTQERVDTSGKRDAISQAAVDGMADLSIAVKVLGKIDYAIVSAIAGQGMTITEYTRSISGANAKKTAREHVGSRFREALGVLAVEFGYESASRSRSRVHRWASPGGAIMLAPAREVSAYVHPRNRKQEARKG